MACNRLGLQLQMQQRFKKVRKGWMEELLASLSANPILACDFVPPLRPYANHHLKFELKSTPRTLNPPDFSLLLDPSLASDLTEKAIRSRKTFHADLLTDSLDSPVTALQELTAQALQGAEENAEGTGFRVGVALVREEGVRRTKERIERELRHCSQRSGARFGPAAQRSQQGPQHLLTRLVRMFLAVDQQDNKLKLARMLYYPKVDLQIHKTKITPFSFIDNEVLKKLKSMSFAKDIMHGYVTLNRNEANSTTQFIMLEPHQFQAKPVPLVGVFLGGRLGGQLKQDYLIWTVIMEYLNNPLIAKRLSLNGQGTGFLFLFQQKGKNTNLQFEAPAGSRWKLTASIQTLSAFPREIVFPNREVIMEQDREQSEAESVHSKPGHQLDPPGDSISSRSFDEKDQEIARLRAEVEYYKQHCAWLTQVVTSLSAQAAQKVPALPPFHSNNPPASFQSPKTSHQDHASHFYSNGQESYLPTQKEVSQGKAEKQFKIRDSKNISFAQQNSYEEQNHSESFLHQQMFQSPQFSIKASLAQKQVKPFETPISHPEGLPGPTYLPTKHLQPQLSTLNPNPKPTFQYKSQNTVSPRTTNFKQPDQYSRNIPENDSKLQNRHSSPPYESSSPLKNPSLTDKYIPIQKPATKHQKSEFEGQRNKAIGSIAPKENAQAHKREEKSEKKEKEKEEKEKEKLRGKKVSDKAVKQGEGEEKKYKHLIDSQSEDDELITIITSRNRKK